MGQKSDNVLRLADYRRPEFITDHVDLKFHIEEDHTNVTSKVTYKRTAEGKGSTEIVLNAENPNPPGKDYIKSVKVNGVEIAEGYGYTFDPKRNEVRIGVYSEDDDIEVEIETYLEPHANGPLLGLYESGGCFLTQCESEGFRRITPFTDRPDVMATYKVTIDAPEDLCPVVLSNGNMIAEGKGANGRHWATYEDPWPKPSYLFCTANGKYNHIEDKFTTMSGREVKLRVFVDPEAGDPEKARHAINAIKMSMKWDEDVFGCEYDLDTFDVVATAKFTFGAMENKGLNVFRDSIVLANPDIASDNDYQRIIDVIGHEYFHNFSGNRVTLANFFNISLKEGLTVMREQMFTAFTTSDEVQRIHAVQNLRGRQFAEDDSPFAHPVLPREVESVENCYSATIYQKGSEVIRMMKIMMGEDTFTDAVKHYFKKHDGQAVTIADFVTCMEEVSGLSFSGQFQNWYDQAGRPRVKAQGVYDAAAKTYTLTLEQHTPPGVDGAPKRPQLLPVVMGLVGKDGKDMKLELSTDTKNTADAGATERTLIFSKPKEVFVFENVSQEPAFHSLFRGFSAPVDVDPGLSQAQLRKQLVSDNDGFNRWEAGQKLALREMVRLYEGRIAGGKMPEVSEEYLDSYRAILTDKNLDPALKSAMLALPGISELERAVMPADPSIITETRRAFREAISIDLRRDLWQTFVSTMEGKPYSFDYDSVGKRSLKAITLNYLAMNGSPFMLSDAYAIYKSADNITDRMTAILALSDHKVAERKVAFDDFHAKVKGDVLVIQKWFAAVALSNYDGVIDDLRQILDSDEFDWENPGHVSSIVGTFGANYNQFHRPDGKGYDFMAECVLREDKINSVTAARLVESLCRWRKFSGDNPALMIEALEKIAAAPGLSRHVRAKVEPSLPRPEERQALGLPQQDTPGKPSL